MGWRIQELKYLWGLKLAQILKEGAFMVRVRFLCGWLALIGHLYLINKSPEVYKTTKGSPLLSLAIDWFVFMWSIASSECCASDFWEMCPKSFLPTLLPPLMFNCRCWRDNLNHQRLKSEIHAIHSLQWIQARVKWNIHLRSHPSWCHIWAFCPLFWVKIWSDQSSNSLFDVQQPISFV